MIPNPEIESEFLALEISNNKIKKALAQKAQGKSVVHIHNTDIQSLNILLTKTSEQIKIIDIFLNLDNLITLHQRYKDEQIFKELNYPYCITNAWEQRKFSELYKKVSEKNDLSYDVDKIISVANMYFKQESYISNKEYLLTYNIFLVGDIAFEGNRSKNFSYGRFVENTIGNGIVSHVFDVFRPLNEYDLCYWKYAINNEHIMKNILARCTKSFLKETIKVPVLNEQKQIGQLFSKIEQLLTLHQRKFLTKFSPKIITKGGIIMLSDISCNDFFYSFFEQWIKVYKEGAVRAVTMKKYYMTLSWVKKIAPTLKLSELTRITYQQLLNEYALSHERQTTMDFHHQLKGAIMDAVDDGLIAKDPTRKAIIKGKQPKEKKIKYLSQFELHNLLSVLDLKGDINWDWLILLVAKTGIRFSEALAITPADFDFSHQTLSISRTWDYKGNGGFLPTKNHSSVRKIQIDWQTVVQFSELVKNLPEDKPIFVKDKKIYNSTINTILARHCKEAKIPIIAIHGLRHTHASLLLFAGVSIASVARRLGHASMTTTQKTYLHIIQELENKDIDLVMRSISGLS